FFIYAEVASGTFSINNNMRAHNSGGKNNPENKMQNGLVLAASNDYYEDKLWLVFENNTSENFEMERDAWKLLSNTPGISQLWSKSPDGNLSIDVRPETGIVQLGFANDQAGVYRIGIQEIADIPEAYLEDTKTGIFHNLQNGDYEFTWYPETDPETRFKLHLNAVGIEETPISESDILIYAANGQIFIKGAENGKVIVSDMMGRIISHQEISSEGLISIQANLKTGVYLVMVINGKNVKTGKVFIK
ncbi:MAG: T9SS type A sorting domain-containing protein, partial [Bacteroidales bacterium]|nr:T9SS type A sorting domain-containing protein [Bacteroidales bacterium]